MRYQIGQTIPVISFVVKSKHDGRNQSRRSVYFLPWEETVISSEIVYLTVSEHHRVLNSYDSADAEPNHDGYILTTADNEVWYNQYPRASYGQLDDTADRHFRRRDYKRGDTYAYYVSLFSYLEGLLQGEHTLIEKSEVSKASMLRTHFEELKARYEEVTGKVMTYVEHEYTVVDADTGKETTDTLPGWFDLIVSDPEPRAWVENTGVAPDLERVDIQFGCDEDDMPGVPCVRRNQDPKEWEWSLRLPYDERITHYREGFLSKFCTPEGAVMKIEDGTSATVRILPEN